MSHLYSVTAVIRAASCQIFPMAGMIPARHIVVVSLEGGPMRFLIEMRHIGSMVRGWRGSPLTRTLILLGLVVPAQIVHAGICELCEARPNLCSPETLAACRSDKSNKKSDTTRSSENSDGRDRSPCGPNPPDKGFVYYKDRSGDRAIHAEPSADSASVGTPPNGIRLVYDQVTDIGGRRWYRVQQPSGPPGWLPSYDVACERPTNPPQGPPDRVRDCDIPMADTSSAQGGSRGYAPGSVCDQYQQQHGPVSFR